MASPDQYLVYQACVENLRAVESCRRDYAKYLNSQILTREEKHVRRIGRVGVLMFSVWAEGRLLKAIYTPHGLEEQEIKSVLAERSLEEKWTRTIELAVRKTPHGDDARYDITRRLAKLVQQYVVGPATVRNKLAHGQWAVALNNEATNVNPETTARIDDLNPVHVDLWYEVFVVLADLVEVLIESPTKGFPKEYWGSLDRIENLIDERKGWSLGSKRKLLLRKKSYTVT